MCYVRPFFVFLAAGAGDFRGKPLLPPLLPPIARAVRRLSEVIAKTDDVLHSEPNPAPWMAVAVTLVPRVPPVVGQPQCH